MKILFILPFLLLLSGVSRAQIVFEHGTFQEALQKAKKENKLVFVDVYTTWCGPCKQMSNSIFPQKEVGDYYNANYVSIKIDAEKGEGIEIARKYGVTAYPTMLYLKPDGTVAGRQIGGVDGTRLVQKGRDVIDPQASPVYVSMQAYHQSKKTVPDLRNYVATLMQFSADSMDFYVDKLYRENRSPDLTNNIDFNVFYLKETNLYSPVTLDFLTHPERTEPQAYISKVSSFLNASFSEAVRNRDYAMLERDVRFLYPYLTKASPQPGDIESYVEYVRTEYGKATGRTQ